MATNRDLYALPASSGSGTINSIKVYIRVGGINSVDYEILIKTHSTIYSHAVDNVTVGWETHSHTWSTNPNTSAAWTWAEIDALQIGVGLFNGQAAPVSCTQIYVEVDYDGSSAPTVTTQAVSSIGTTTATGNGNITDDGGITPSAWGVCVGTSANPDTGDTVFSGSGAGAEGAFTAAMTSLTEGTAYHARAYATNTEGTGYGADVEFSTNLVITATLLTMTGDLLIPTLVRNTTFISALLTADGTMLVPTLVRDSIFTSSLLTMTGDLLVPTLALDRNITASLLSGDLALLIPSIDVGVNAEVLASLLTGDLAMLVAAISTIKNPTIAASLLTADLAQLIPTLVLDRKLESPVMESDLALLTPALSLGTTLTSSLLTMDGALLVPTLSLDRIFTSALMEADLAALVPTLALDRKITASLLTGDLALSSPTLSISVGITATLLTANMVLLVPYFEHEGQRFYGHAYTVRFIDGVGYTVRYIEGVAYTGG